MTERAARDEERRIELGALMLGDHGRLDALLAEVTLALEQGRQTQAIAAWVRFHSALRAHLELEERHLISRFAANEPREAQRLLRDHDQLREQMIEVGMGIDLNLASPESLERFIQLLRAHARREEALLYAWTERGLAESERSPLRQRMTPGAGAGAAQRRTEDEPQAAARTAARR